MRRINNSEIQAFKRCRRKWYLSHVQHYQLRAVRTGALNVGTAVHLGLEEHYNGVDNDGVLARIDTAFGVASMHVDPEDTVTHEKLEKDFQLATLMVEGYLDWLEETGADAGYKTTGVELLLEMPLEIPGFETVTLHGKLDRLVEDADGRTFIYDHKTCQSFDIAGRQLQMDDQLLTYVMLVEHNYGVQVAGCVYDMLRKVKRGPRAVPPFYARETVIFNRNQIAAHKAHTIATIAVMLNAERNWGADNSEFYPSPTRDCSYCDFLPVCPMIDDGSDWQGMLNNYYTTPEEAV